MASWFERSSNEPKVHLGETKAAMLDRHLRNADAQARHVSPTIPPTTGNTSVQWVQPSLEQTINTAFQRMQAAVLAEDNEPTQVMSTEALRPLLNLTFNTDFEDDIITQVDIDVTGL